MLKLPRQGINPLFFLCPINLSCPLLRPGGDETPAEHPPCAAVITRQGREHPRPLSPGHFSASCVKAIKAIKAFQRRIRHLNSCEEGKGFAPPQHPSPPTQGSVSRLAAWPGQSRGQGHEIRKAPAGLRVQDTAAVRKSCQARQGGDKR